MTDQSNAHSIVTDCIYPPIPDRTHDWYARLDSHDGDTDLNGHGETEAEAVLDLLKNCSDYDGDGSEQEELVNLAFAAWNDRPAPRPDVIEIAKHIYDAMMWAADAGPPPIKNRTWVHEGNSHAQVEARATANSILSLFGYGITDETVAVQALQDRVPDARDEGGRMNRSLKDVGMDNIDHALGRPFDPMSETSRNNFMVEPDENLASHFRASPNWREGRTFCGMTSFHVTDIGRRALASHLRDIGDQNRQFVVTFDGYPSTVIATTRGKAKYLHFLTCDFTDIDFGEFCRRTSVWAAPLGDSRKSPAGRASQGDTRT